MLVLSSGDVSNLESSPNDANSKALETISKVEQGVAYWDKLAPLLEDVMSRTIGGVGLSSNGTATTNNTADSIVGSISTTTASTLAHLRLVSSIPSSPGFQASMRSVQSSWSAMLPYLSALSANSNRTHSVTTLVRLVGLLADRCSGLHTALDEAYTKWLLEEKDEDDATVGEALKSLARAADRLVKVLKKNVEIGLVQNCQIVSTVTTALNVLGQDLNSSSGTGNAGELNNSTGREHLQVTSSDPPSPTSLSSPDDSHLSSNTSAASGSVTSDARLAQLHRQREHWRLEYHLLSHKYNKLMKVLKDRKTSDVTLQAADIESSRCAKVQPSSILGEAILGNDCHNHTRDDGVKPDCASAGNKLVESSDGESWRESMIRHHLTSRCSKLFLELTSVTSKATMFQVRTALGCDSYSRTLGMPFS